MIKEFGDNADKAKWNYVGILIRKIYANGALKAAIWCSAKEKGLFSNEIA